MNQTDIPSYLAQTFYTPPPALSPGSNAFLVNNWEEGGPLLPPQITCNCDSLDVVYSSKLQLTPDLPVLPTSGGTGAESLGSTAMVAYLRLFRDPAYSLLCCNKGKRLSWWWVHVSCWDQAGRGGRDGGGGEGGGRRRGEWGEVGGRWGGEEGRRRRGGVFA